MARPRKRPHRYYRATDTFGGNYPESNEPYSFHAGQIVSEKVVKRLGTTFFELLDQDIPIEVMGGETDGAERPAGQHSRA